MGKLVGIERTQKHIMLSMVPFVERPIYGMSFPLSQHVTDAVVASVARNLRVAALYAVFLHAKHWTRFYFISARRYL